METENSGKPLDGEAEESTQQEGEMGPVDDDGALNDDFLQAVLGELGKQNEKLAQEKELAEEKYTRLQADFDNYRRRTERERDSLAVFANETLVKTLIPVLDNLDRAIASAQGGEEDPVVAGVLLVRKQLVAALERAGLCEVEAVGKPFDPTLHEAIGQATADGVEDGVVIDEFQKGYVLGGRLLRACMVRVCKN